MATFDDCTQMLGNGLQTLLMAPDICPGDGPSYAICKAIYSYHPHGAKLVDFPVQMAQYKPRKITVPKAPDDGKLLVEAFQAEYRSLRAERHILNVGRLARMYGVATLGLMVEGEDTKEPVDFKKLAKAKISFNTWDPLNTAGSLVLNQDPNAMDYQKVSGVSVNGQAYHRNRTCVIMNEDPLYIEYQSSGFGFLGRSVYQRGLVPLKSFVLTLATDMMIALKAGVLIAKIEATSSAVDAPMSWIYGQKRELIKEAQTGNVINIGVNDDIMSLNLQNLDGAYGMARKNIIENEAAACGTPAKIVLAETYAEGFGEGTEDAKAVAQYVDGIRTWLDPLYEFMDQIAMYRAWNEEMFDLLKSKYPKEYADTTYETAFHEWKNSFTAEWPNLLDEPDSEKLKGEDVVLRAIIAVVEVLLPELDPDNKARVVEWMMENLNANKRLFSSPMELDLEALANYEPPTPESAPKEPDAAPPESQRDSQPVKRRVKERLDGVDEEVRLRALDGLRLVQGHAAAAGGNV